MKHQSIFRAILGCLALVTFFIGASFIVPRIPALSFIRITPISNYLASVFFTPSITVAQLMNSSAKADQGQGKIKVLIVAGHEPNFGGAEYKDVKERNISVKIEKDLAQFFKDNGRYEVTMSRDENSWDPIFQTYFKEEWPTLPAWIKQHSQDMAELQGNGKLHAVTNNMIHNNAPTDVALRLYAINKWVDDNKIDIVIHIHINDYPGHGSNGGKYTGFAIYVPEHQYSNAGATHDVANNVFTRLSKYFPVSNLGKESSGLVEDQELIAIGSKNTVDAVSMLVEYGYIYEPMFSTGPMQDIAAKEMAFQTYLGVQDFFGKGNDVSLTSNSITLPYVWNTDIQQGGGPTPDGFALQLALASKGYYPPAGRTKNDCSLSGILSPCTLTALSNFQKKNSIVSESFFGPKTRSVLNTMVNSGQ